MSADLRLLLSLNDASEILPKVQVEFDDGSIPSINGHAANTARFAAENAEWDVVEGWLITGSCIFTKHSAVVNRSGRIVEITPRADPLPFAKHWPQIGSYDEMASELYLLNEDVPPRAHHGKPSK